MTLTLALLLQEEVGGGAAGAAAFGIAGTMMILMLAVAVVFIVGLWKVFVKAGQPGWAVLIPIYNAYILLKIAGRPAWWILLFLIPLVNIVIAALVSVDVAKAFGKSAAFGLVLLFLLCGIGYLLLGFGKCRYVGPAASVTG